jgi:hypothetical protein
MKYQKVKDFPVFEYSLAWYSIDEGKATIKDRLTLINKDEI